MLSCEVEIQMFPLRPQHVLRKKLGYPTGVFYARNTVFLLWLLKDLIGCSLISKFKYNDPRIEVKTSLIAKILGCNQL